MKFLRVDVAPPSSRDPCHTQLGQFQQEGSGVACEWVPRGDTVQRNGANEGEPKRCESRQYGFNSREVIEE